MTKLNGLFKIWTTCDGFALSQRHTKTEIQDASKLFSTYSSQKPYF